MLILYNSFLLKKNLLNICKINNIKNYSKLNKYDLLQLLNFNKSIIYIQKKFRNKLIEEWICPITYNDLKYPFISIKNNNKFRYYSLSAFIEYLNKSTNDFIDPFTRELLSNSSIKQLENLIKFYKIKKNI